MGGVRKNQGQLWQTCLAPVGTIREDHKPQWLFLQRAFQGREGDSCIEARVVQCALTLINWGSVAVATWIMASGVGAHLGTALKDIYSMY